MTELFSTITREFSLSNLSLRQAFDAYIQAQSRLLSPQTIRVYKQSLRYLLQRIGEDTTLEEITKSDMLQWRDSLFAKKLSVHTIRRIHGDAATFFNWMVAIGLIARSPMAGVKKPVAPDTGPKAISLADFQRLLAEAGKYRGNKWRHAAAYKARNTAIVLFLASTGCRVGGLCSARLGTLQIFDGGAQVDVTEKGRGGGKVRTVYLSETAALALLDWLDHRPETGHDIIFVTLEGKNKGLPVKPVSIRKLFDRLGERAGIEGRVNPHAFRHACAREWLRAGADLQTVSQLLGHSDIRTTSKFYARWSNTELRDSHGRVDWTESD